MKIAIFSDIHAKSELFLNALEFLIKRGTQAIIIAGDIGSKKCFMLAAESGLPIYAVLGNNDSHLKNLVGEFNLYVEPYCFNLNGVRFKLSHHPFFMTPDMDIIIYGHTHTQDIRFGNGVLYLNPGEICAREKDKSECISLEILENKFIVTAFLRSLNSNTWEETTFEYER